MPNREQSLFVAFVSLLAVLSSSATDASDCPVINGRFYRDWSENGRMWRRFSPIWTKVDGGKYSYRFNDDDPFYLANGDWNTVEINSALRKVRVICTASYIRLEIEDDQSKKRAYKVYRRIDDDRIAIESNTQSHGGIYVREQ